MQKFVLFFLALTAFSCTKKPSATSPETLTTDQAIERGMSIYKLNCIACHNVDPGKDGVAGPALTGSSKELLEARILRAAYPAGYKPKRDTKQMPALPHLEKEIPAISAYLNK